MTIDQFVNVIHGESSRRPVHGGKIHPMTRYVLNYCGLLAECRTTLDMVLADNNNTNDDHHDGGGASSSGRCMRELLTHLLRKLDEKSRLYDHTGLQNIFLMNNLYCIICSSSPPIPAAGLPQPIPIAAVAPPARPRQRLPVGQSRAAATRISSPPRFPTLTVVTATASPRRPSHRAAPHCLALPPRPRTPTSPLQPRSTPLQPHHRLFPPWGRDSARRLEEARSGLPSIDGGLRVTAGGGEVGPALQPRSTPPQPHHRLFPP
ncbi:hypothetical protein OsI_34043 [Oryza sativa Indica Group]|uniref:Exocyst subunit Exo70 family protein n=1 Tax=Oryza sativa subsp. indica TaxID=39946 RepID=B8BHH3_ORYSI|nr:hypothetical protein OsI_34043 [Oryza sativa Indica Group]